MKNTYRTHVFKPWNANALIKRGFEYIIIFFLYLASIVPYLNGSMDIYYDRFTWDHFVATIINVFVAVDKKEKGILRGKPCSFA